MKNFYKNIIKNNNRKKMFFNLLLKYYMFLVWGNWLLKYHKLIINIVSLIFRISCSDFNFIDIYLIFENILDSIFTIPSSDTNPLVLYMNVHIDTSHLNVLLAQFDNAQSFTRKKIVFISNYS